VIAKPVYMDNHATTRVDPRVLDAMLPYFSQTFGNAGSSTHQFGWAAKEAVDAAREKIASGIGARAREIVFTSGATESNNLAIRGVAEKYVGKGKHLVSVAIEHPSVFDPLEKLRRRGFDVTLLPVIRAPDRQAGRIAPEQVARAVRDDTILVSVMLANHEIGVIQPLEEIGRICKQRGVLLHTDATQAVGKIPVDVQRLQVDLMSLSAHKIYGPKGVGALYVRRRSPHVRLEPILDGGGQEGGLRSGALNVPGIVGFARALELCLEGMPEDQLRLRDLRDRLFAGLTATLPDLTLHGPLNVSFGNVDGGALLMSVRDVALSSGGACSSASPEPSHVVRGLGVAEVLARGSVRFGLGRFNTEDEVEFAVRAISEAVVRLRRMTGLT
jgi:cysteine desulfurase